MSAYLLSNHVHLRMTNEGAILLDLHRDEYVALSHSQVAVLRSIVHGWSVQWSTELGSQAEGSGTAEFVDALLKRSLVTTDALNGKPAAEASIEPAETSLVELEPNSRVLRPRHVTHFFYAGIRTLFALRTRSLDRVVAAMAMRKQTRAAQGARPSIEVDELMTAFMVIRPFVYTPKDHCLFDSIVLVHFLAAYGYSPRLVFGVRTNPFEAHAWVQQDRCVLNSAAEYVHAFLPIMVI